MYDWTKVLFTHDPQEKPQNRLGKFWWCQNHRWSASLPRLLSEVQGPAGPAQAPNRLLKYSGPGLICAYLAKMSQHIAPFFSVPAGEKWPKAFSKSHSNLHCHRTMAAPMTRLLNKAISQPESDATSDRIHFPVAKLFLPRCIWLCCSYRTLETSKKTPLPDGLEHLSNWVTLRKLVACTVHNCLFNLGLENY